jgi:hypothetical protein
MKRLERLKNTVNKYMADIRPDRLTTCQSERKSGVSRRQSLLPYNIKIQGPKYWSFILAVKSKITRTRLIFMNIGYPG